MLRKLHKNYEKNICFENKIIFFSILTLRFWEFLENVNYLYKHQFIKLIYF